MTLALYAPSDCRRSKKRLTAYEQKHEALAVYLASDAGKIEAGMYALGLACERAIKRDPEYRSAHDG